MTEDDSKTKVLTLDVIRKAVKLSKAAFDLVTPHLFRQNIILYCNYFSQSNPFLTSKHISQISLLVAVMFYVLSVKLSFYIF